MESSAPYKLPIILSLGLMTGCLDDNSHSTNTQANNDENCPTTNLISQRTLTPTTLYYGDASDGEFYLAADDIFPLDEQIYNFSNVYTEPGSTLTVSDGARGGTEKIVINSVGNCDFFGDIMLADYNGTLEINCYSTINFSIGSISLGATELTATDASSVVVNSSELIIGEVSVDFVPSFELIVAEEFEFGSDAIISTDLSSVVINSGELTISGVSAADVPTLELGETSITNPPTFGVVTTDPCAFEHNTSNKQVHANL